MLKIVYEDESLLLIDKPQGLATTPGKQESLCDRVFQEKPELKNVKGYNEKEGGLLNRLDNETGGLVFFAKSDEAFLYYSGLMKDEKVEKYYQAWVEGLIVENEGKIDLPIAHHVKNPRKMTIASNNKRYRSNPQLSETFFKVLKRSEDRTLLEIKITKGVRHQIRVHLSAIGHPVVGDKLYSALKIPCFNANHLLYANRVCFVSKSGQKIDLSVEAGFEE